MVNQKNLIAILVIILSLSLRAEAESDLVEIRQRLMSYEEYRSLELGPPPYFLVVEAPGQRLYFCGFSHCYDPLNPAFDLLEAFWRRFSESSEGGSTVLVLEGGVAPQLSSKKDAILKYGENGLMVHLANNEVGQVVSPDRESGKEIVECLLRLFDSRQVFYYHLAAVIAQWHRQVIEVPFEEYIQPFLDSERVLLGDDSLSYTLEELEQIHEEIFGQPFDVSDESFFVRVTDPTVANPTDINEVAIASSQLRDAVVVREVLLNWEEGRSVFVVFGATHAVMQAPAYDDLAGDRWFSWTVPQGVDQMKYFCGSL